MKLSMAIREGAALSTQARLDFFKFKDDKVQSSCALGSAICGIIGSTDMEAVNLICRRGIYEYLREICAPEYASYHDIRVDSPDSMANNAELFEVVQYLNDTLCWSREKIADWLEGKGF